MDRTAQLHHYFYIGPAFLEESLEYCCLRPVLSVPLGIAAGVLIALLLNQKVKGMRFFRTIFYFADRRILSCGFSAVDVDSGT